MEYITIGYFDEIKKQRVKEHSNERGFSNFLVYPTVTRKLRHISRDKSLVNPYKKPQRLIMPLLELFSDEGDLVLGLFSGTGN